MKTTLGEKPVTIGSIAQTHHQRHACGEQRIYRELVHEHQLQEQGGGQLEHHFQHANGGKGIHVLMGDDGGIVGYAEQAQDKDKQGALPHPSCRSQPLGGDVDPMVERPQTHRFAQQHHAQAYNQQDAQAGGENLCQAAVVGLPQLEGDETADGGGQGIGEHPEHGHGTCHSVVDAEILEAQCLQHHTTGVERHSHDEERTHIEVERILGYS